MSLDSRKLFGRSSERFVDDESQLRLFETGDEQVSVDELEDDQEDDSKTKRRRRKKKSEKIPSHLKRKVIEADVSPEKRMCSCCGEEMPIIGTDITERVDLIPAELFVWEIHRHKRACGKCKDTIAQVPAGEEPGGLTTVLSIISNEALVPRFSTGFVDSETEISADHRTGICRF